MYDSDEVRDKVRQEMLGMALSPAASMWKPSPVERAALAEAREELQALVAYLAEVDERADRLERFRAAIQAWVSEFVRAVEDALRPVLEQFAEALEAVGERFRDLAEVIGLLDEDEAPEPFLWQKRPRTAAVRLVRHVDAVAAGRHPAMTMRTRVRGGRR